MRASRSDGYGRLAPRVQLADSGRRAPGAILFAFLDDYSSRKWRGQVIGQLDHAAEPGLKKAP